MLIEIQVHYMEKQSETERHSHPSWSLLTDEAKVSVVRREEFDPYIKDKSWTCAHGSVHYLAPVIRKEPINHCKAAYVSLFPPSSAVLLLLPCPCACFSRVRLFFWLDEGTKSDAQSKTSTSSTSSRRNELRADQLYCELFMIALS